jgi:hypothetical protein
VESLVGEMMSLRVTPDRLDVIEFGPLFAQHLESCNREIVTPHGVQFVLSATGAD